MNPRSHSPHPVEGPFALLALSSTLLYTSKEDLRNSIGPSTEAFKFGKHGTD